MEAGENRTRMWTGVLLEVIFLTSVLGFGAAPRETAKSDSDLVVSVASTVMVEPICRIGRDYAFDPSVVLKHVQSDVLLIAAVFDIPRARITRVKELFLSLSERNVFYVFTTIHAP